MINPALLTGLPFIWSAPLQYKSYRIRHKTAAVTIVQDVADKKVSGRRLSGDVASMVMMLMWNQ